MLSSQQPPKTDTKHWEYAWLEANDIKKLAMEKLDAKELEGGNLEKLCLDEEFMRSYFFERNGKVFVITPDHSKIKQNVQLLTVLSLNEIFTDGYTQIKAINDNHWVAVKAEKQVNGEFKYKVCDSLMPGAVEKMPNTPIKDQQFNIVGTIAKELGLDITHTKDVRKKFIDYDSPVLQEDGYNCGIFATLNAIDMGEDDTSKYCTQDNIAQCRKWFCETKAAEALKGETEFLYTTYNKWKVTAPSPLKKQINDSPLMTLLTNEGLVEKNNTQKMFLFKEDDSEAKAYIDKNYNHSNIILQTTIEKHTTIITNGLTKAYNEVYGTTTPNFDKIKQIKRIWDIAQQEGKWKKLREKEPKSRTNEERQMLQFSAAFQRHMESNGLMTGNLNATNFVGMRLKRVSQYHMDALEKALQEKTSTNNVLNANNLNSKSTTQFTKKVHFAQGVDEKEKRDKPVNEFVTKFMDNHNKNFKAALSEIQAGNKKDCWMWYIFPQLKGTGGAMNNEDIPNFQTAEKLSQNETFVKNYLTMLTAVDEQCQKSGNGYNMTYLRKLFGSDLDAKKFVSSITLFEVVSKDKNNKTHKNINALTQKFFINDSCIDGITRCNNITQKIAKEKGGNQR